MLNGNLLAIRVASLKYIARPHLRMVPTFVTVYPVCSAHLQILRFPMVGAY